MGIALPQWIKLEIIGFILLAGRLILGIIAIFESVLLLHPKLLLCTSTPHQWSNTPVDSYELRTHGPQPQQ